MSTLALVALLMVSAGGGQSTQDRIRALMERAQAAEQRENLDEAAEAYREILRLQPHWAAAKFNLALVYYTQKSYTEAIRLFTEALQDDPSLADVYLFRGVAYYHTNQYGEALSSLKRFLALRPHDQQVHSFLAATYYGMGDYSQAALQYLEQSRISPNEGSVYYYLCRTYRSLAAEALRELERQKALPGRKAELEEVFNKGLQECQRAPGAPRGHVTAACSVARSDFSTATAVLVAAQSHTPHDPGTEYSCFRLYNLMAQGTFAKLVALSPDSYFVARLRAAGLQQQGQFAEADRQYDLAARLGRDDPDVFVEWGKLKDAMGQYREALLFSRRPSRSTQPISLPDPF